MKSTNPAGPSSRAHQSSNTNTNASTTNATAGGSYLRCSVKLAGVAVSDER